jgi:AcrR family transcriptional regulator
MAREAVATRERIQRAAFVRFSRYGYRRTSMEDIASEAGVSRAALYLQFRNKEEIFRSLAEDLHTAAIARATAAAATDLAFADRLRETIEAKTLEMVELTCDSPHGVELLDEHNRSCGDVVAAGRKSFLDLLQRLFRRAAAGGEIDLAAAGLTAAEAAELLHASLQGLKGPGVSVDAYRARVASLVRVFAAAVSAQPPRASKLRAARRS